MKWLFGWSKFSFLVLGVFIILRLMMPKSDFSDNNQRDGSKQVNESNQQAGAEQMETDEYAVIPPGEGDWETMWSRLVDLETIYTPAHSVKEFLTPQQKNGESVDWANVDDVLERMAKNPPKWSEERGIFLLDTPKPQGGMMRVMIAYTDERLLKKGVHYWGFDPIEFLELALYHPRAQGLGFNPYVEEVSAAQVHASAVNKFLIATLVGYLLVEQEEPNTGSHYLQALQAREENQPYQAIYHAEQSRQRKEPWEKGEMARIWAWHALNFPGAQEMALEGIRYLTKKGLVPPQDRSLEKAIAKKLADGSAGHGVPRLSSTEPTALFVQANEPLRLPFEPVSQR